MSQQSLRGHEADAEVVSEWTIRVCEECGRRAAPACNFHPEAYIVGIRVVPKDPERFTEEVGPE